MKLQLPIKTRVKRVTTGCRDCRHRRVKCPEGELAVDGRKMPCGRCQQVGVECWYPKRGNGRAGEWEPASGIDTDKSIIDYCSRKPLGSSRSASRSVSATASTATATAALIPISTTAPTTQPDLFFDFDWSPELLNALLNPSPTAPVWTQSLSGLSTRPNEQSVMSYFENRGCTEIVAAPSNRMNWIYTMLFPRLLNLLSSNEVDTGRAAIKEYANHSLLRLSFVHRANTVLDPVQRAELRQQAALHKRQADYSLIMAKVRFAEESWKSEEYLMAFFTACMADMLDSQPFAIDYNTAFDISPTLSEFASSLRDMIGVYSTIMAACSPHDSTCTIRLFPGPNAVFELPPEGNEWVERFFGVGRPLLVMVGRVNRMVLDRRELLRATFKDETTDVQIRIIQDEARQLVRELGPGWMWNEACQPIGKSARIQMGTEVTRLALMVMLLCEVLEVPLSDPRIDAAGRAAMELVDDTPPEEAAGYTWAVSMIAVYTIDPAMRTAIQSALRNAQAWSFGTGYQGADDIMDMCWKVCDARGGYPNGIAPWREALAACGRSMYV